MSTLPKYLMYIDEKKEFHLKLLFCVPRPGIEPGWVAPLVFETSASTDSAIWATLDCECKGSVFFLLRKEK